MAPRPFWTGYLKLSLVTCPVALTPATSDAERVRFHTLNWKTGNRVVSRYVDSATGQPVDDASQVKGYARDEGSFVLLEEDELQAVQLESARAIDIERHDNRVGRDRADLKNEQAKRPAVAIRDDRLTSRRVIPACKTQADRCAG